MNGTKLTVPGWCGFWTCGGSLFNQMTFLFELEKKKKTFYHINYGVRQRFLAQRTAVTTHLKKNYIFSRVFDIANQLLTCHSPFAPLGQVDEWIGKLNITPIVVFVIMIQRIFQLSLGPKTVCDFYSGIVDSFYFHSSVKSAFLVSKGLLCLND